MEAYDTFGRAAETKGALKVASHADTTAANRPNPDPDSVLTRRQDRRLASHRSQDPQHDADDR